MTATDEVLPVFIQQGRLYRWSVARYHQLIAKGVLAETERVHLLEGYLIRRPVPDPPHSQAVTRSFRAVVRVLPADWELRSEQPITLADSEPQPDLVLARGEYTKYRTRHPGPADIGLVVEVADTSLPVDRNDMGRIYARANLPVYWIINVVDRQVEVYTDPRPADPVPAYAARTDHRPGDSVPLVLDGQNIAQIPVDDLLG